MESKRQLKFAGLIQEELAALFLKDGKSFLPDTLVTITKVKVTPDLAIARVYLSFFQPEKKDEALVTLRAKSNEVRYKLGSKIRHQARIVPQLAFFVDDTNEYVAHMDALFQKIEAEREASGYKDTDSLEGE